MNIRVQKFNEILDCFEIVLSLISIIVLTLFFRMYSTSIRYLFLLVDFCLVISLSRLLTKLDINNKKEERVIRYNNSKINPKYIKKVRF